MADNSKLPTEPARTPVTDSPWFWLALFLVGALCALGVVAPKYAYRQARLERMNDTREQIRRRLAESPEDQPANDALDAPALDVNDRGPRAAPLDPLAMVLSLLLAVVAIGIGVASYLRAAARRSELRKPELLE